MEDIYIYIGKNGTRIFFNSEGSDDFLDLIGSFKE